MDAAFTQEDRIIKCKANNAHLENLYEIQIGRLGNTCWPSVRHIATKWHTIILRGTTHAMMIAMVVSCP